MLYAYTLITLKCTLDVVFAKLISILDPVDFRINRRIYWVYNDVYLFFDCTLFPVQLCSVPENGFLCVLK